MGLRKLSKTDRLIHLSELIHAYAAIDDKTVEEAGELFLSWIQDAGATLYSFPPGKNLAQELTPQMMESVWREVSRQELMRDNHLAISIDELPSVLGYELPAGMTLFRTPDRTADVISHPTPQSGEHVSKQLALLKQAAWRWWANADKNDPLTHPDKADVVAWLTSHGMTQSLATHAATIIRPEWAHTGRKPDA